MQETTISTRTARTSRDQARPGLALLLALLSVPGSTVAWSLPAGGLWIGLPLAVAAITLGLGARRELVAGSGSRIATAAIAIGSLAIAQMVVYTLVSIAS